MYLSGGNATASMSFLPARNPAEQAEIKSYYIIIRETLAHKSIYDHLTRMATVDKIINVNASKAPREAKK